MTDPQTALRQMDLTEYTFQRQLRGITDADALLQPPFRANCLNWVLGHLVEARNYMLEILGAERVWSVERCKPYETGSSPITSAADPHYPLAEILDGWTKCGERLRARLQSMTPADFDVPTADPDYMLSAEMDRLLWHEAYHLGQIEFLRQLAGKNDHIL